MFRFRWSPGFSLIEVLACIVISTVLVGMAWPSMQGLTQRSKSTSAVNWVVGAIVFTRHSAIKLGSTVTLCPSNTGSDCRGSWQSGMISFTDRNQDGRLNGSDRLLNWFQPPVSDISIRWRSFRYRPYVQMTPQGYTNYQNGNFLFCPGNRDSRFARQLILNMAGRIRHARDSNRDGIVEDASGTPLRC